ncbi:glycosyltransferase family 39 protein [Fulvivirga ulvae]|uniref:ArnT family glycosyltransferase n=1 Tax=Fulvivirga ulvae TaxID=2904245 RepID=UPI001F1EA988|nr:glycosyltransferase family 39 protein [Fulvivirga ulvae]UII31728.1 glycosyltransferase family 39 protein [Fulvivirga ulvae]
MTSINKSRISVFIEENPLKAILLAALVLRLLAAFFSKGYAFHDDHFCVIRVANSWAEGIPQWLQGEHPPKHSMVYAGANAILMWLMSTLGITDPEVKATVLRLVHALYSMFTVYFGFKITALISNKRNAILAGWILAVLWFMPYLSVKYLAELVCAPPVLAGFYIILKAERARVRKWAPWILAGALFGLSFTIRLHIILFAGGLGLVLLFRKQWLESILFTIGFLLLTFVLIGIPDILFFDYPYQYVVDYFIYNSENAYNYITGSPFKFLLTTFGFLVPPVSVFLMWGYIKTWKIEPKMFLAVLIFFLVHSFFPNKQERFLLPMYPLLIILGVIGWNNFKDHSRFWQGHQSLYRGLWKFFWTINIIAAVALALTFTKKDRVAPLYYLSRQTDVKAVIIESERGKVKQPPVYYLGNNCADFDEVENGELGFDQFEARQKYADPEFIVTFNLGKDKTIQELSDEIASTGKEPNYIIFKGDQDFEARMKRIQEFFPCKQLVLVKEINPSTFDLLLHVLNPRVHRNTMARIYRVE